MKFFYNYFTEIRIYIFTTFMNLLGAKNYLNCSFIKKQTIPQIFFKDFTFIFGIPVLQNISEELLLPSVVLTYERQNLQQKSI